MKNEIYVKVLDLGGDVLHGNQDSLRENLKRISFSNSLYDRDWGLFGLRDFYAKESTLYKQDKEKFIKEAVIHFRSAGHSDFFGQSFWVDRLFSPMKEGSPDYNEWQELLSDQKCTYFAEVRKVVGDGELEFVQLISSYGYPDHYFVCLSDPVPENPTVFGTDHEELFQNIRNYGSLETFLSQFLNDDELARVIADEAQKIHLKTGNVS